MQEKNLALLKDRSEKLKPLAAWHPTECQLEVRLTQPALARYRNMFSGEQDEKVLASPDWKYTWKVRKISCEIVPQEPSAPVTNHLAFLHTAMCLLLQVHWINSPFEQLDLSPDAVIDDHGRAHLRTSSDPNLGLYLDPIYFTIETKTKNRGRLKATYGQFDREWLPTALEHETGSVKLTVDAMEYLGLEARLNGRRTLRSFWISVGGGGDDKVFQHTQVQVKSCQLQ